MSIFFDEEGFLFFPCIFFQNQDTVKRKDKSGRRFKRPGQVRKEAAQLVQAGRFLPFHRVFLGMSMENEQQKYRVLARKYRPKVFSDLIGQEALVRTITNAIQKDRLAQAYILTGIRGVGKTSSARIIARAFNCVGPDGKGGMTPNPCGVCKHCQDIANDCHVDVIEIDAASNTGVDNIREIIEGAKYNPLSARYKIYIIDEVHMLSKSAFNALLKTLEEPPERLKFIFATTEIRKVPVTILSRCQRFDLRRIDQKTLTDYFKSIAQKENVTAEEEAIALIAKAADGSVRDGLSLLDQAIAHGNGDVTTEQVRQMIGLTDKTILFDLYEKLMQGKIEETLKAAESQYNLGTDPLILAQDLLELTHWLTRIKISPELANDITISETEKEMGKKMASSLAMSTLTRTWQMLLKGVSEIKFSESPLKSLEMLLIRLAYASELPTPLELIEEFKKNPASVPEAQKKTEKLASPPQSVPEKPSISPNPTPSVSRPMERQPIRSVTDIVVLAKKAGEMLLSFNVANFVHPVEINMGKLHFTAPADAPGNLCQTLRQFLDAQTGIKWDIAIVEGTGGHSLKEEAQENKRRLKETLSAHPLVQEVLSAFPGAKVDTFHLHKGETFDDTHSFDKNDDENML